jgi:L-iditol 2-dehydrogenase
LRAAVFHGPNDLRVEDRPRPSIASDEALLRVRGCGICGTDHRIVAGESRYYPIGTIRIPGHEVVGEIVDAGADVRDAFPSGLVFVAPNMGCGHCAECLSGNNSRCPQFHGLGITDDGGFAEFLRIPAAAIRQGNIIPLSAGIDPAIATLIEPLACVLRGQEPLDIKPGNSVLVIGAGPVGILHLMLARLKGAGRVMIADRWPRRLQLAVEQGADVAIDVTERDLAATILQETGGRGADVVIVAAPSAESAVQALDLAAPGGRISWFAGLPKDRATVEVDANRVHYRELRITGTTACSTQDCWRAAEIVNSERLDLAPLVTRRRPISEASAEFGKAKDHASLKTVLHP